MHHMHEVNEVRDHRDYKDPTTRRSGDTLDVSFFGRQFQILDMTSIYGSRVMSD
jgi:hypothetical protein